MLAVTWLGGYTLAMFIKLTRSGARTYAQLVESFRDEHGKPRQRTVATLGRIDNLRGFKENVIMGHIIPAGTGFGNHLKVRLKPLVQVEEDLIAEDVSPLAEEPVAG